jgi:transposase
MGIRRTEEFRNEAVRIALTSGLSLKQVSDDLDIGLSTLGKWVAAREQDELMSGSAVCAKSWMSAKAVIMPG